MSVNVPRAEIDVLNDRHNHPWDLDEDPTSDLCRWVAADRRFDADYAMTEEQKLKYLAWADDLDALADRVEREAAL